MNQRERDKSFAIIRIYLCVYRLFLFVNEIIKIKLFKKKAFPALVLAYTKIITLSQARTSLNDNAALIYSEIFKIQFFYGQSPAMTSPQKTITITVTITNQLGNCN